MNHFYIVRIRQLVNDMLNRYPSIANLVTNYLLVKNEGKLSDEVSKFLAVTDLDYQYYKEEIKEAFLDQIDCNDRQEVKDSILLILGLTLKQKIEVAVGQHKKDIRDMTELIRNADSYDKSRYSESINTKYSMIAKLHQYLGML